MKLEFFLLITIFIFSNVEAQVTKSDEEKILEFIIKEKVISANSIGRLIYSYYLCLYEKSNFW
jgi:hypothetical protein